MKTHQTAVESNRSVSANLTDGVVEKLRAYFFRYPNTRPKSACRAVNLDPRRYAATARVIKHRVRKMWGGANVQADPLRSLSAVHRQLFYLCGGVPYGPILDAMVRIAKSGCNRENVWFFSNNQNRQLNFRCRELAIRILPTTRRLEVLCRVQGMPATEIREKFRDIMSLTLSGHLPADYDIPHVAEQLAWKLIPIERHRRFEFPAGPHYRLRFYENTFGLVIQHDLSENMNQQEAIEKIPPWILDLIQAIERLSEDQRELKQRTQQVINILETLALTPEHERITRLDSAKPE